MGEQKKTKIGKLSPKQEIFIKEYFDQLGHIGLACDAAKIGRTTFYKWLRTNEFFKTKFEAVIERHNDSVQQRILKKALNEDNEMLKFWAKNQMKHRGFIEKQEISHSGQIDNKIELEIIEVTKKEDETSDN